MDRALEKPHLAPPTPPRGDWPERQHLQATLTTWEPGPGDLPYFSHLLA